MCVQSFVFDIFCKSPLYTTNVRYVKSPAPKLQDGRFEPRRTANLDTSTKTRKLCKKEEAIYTRRFTERALQVLLGGVCSASLVDYVGAGEHDLEGDDDEDEHTHLGRGGGDHWKKMLASLLRKEGLRSDLL